MEINQQKLVKVDVKTMKLHAKIRDGFSGTLVDSQGETVRDFDNDYVPGFFPGDHYGDYLILDIDIDTGHITNWKKPTAEKLEEAINVAD